jgi:hypothetical protein
MALYPDWGKVGSIITLGSPQGSPSLSQHAAYSSPFAPSDSNCLNFKLPIESSPQAQPL